MIKQLLKDFDFFSDIDDNLLDEIVNISILKRYKKDEIVFYEGEKTNYLHYLAKGEMKLYKNRPNGSEIFIRKFISPCFVAELANINDIPFPSSLSSLNDSFVIKIDYKKFMHIFKDNKAVTDRFIPSLSEKITYLHNFIYNEIALNSNARVAKLIVEKKEIFKTTKQNQIASELNLAPETFSRILAKFKQDGAIDMQGKEVIILDKDYLMELYQ